MTFLENLSEEANITLTANGAVTHASSGDACLDFFAVAGGMRYRKKRDQIRLFERAYIENPGLAMKLLFHLRDIREGMGERQLFRNLIRHVALTWPESAGKNVHLIAEYGRFDDLMCLLDTPCEEAVVSLIKAQLDADVSALQEREQGNVQAHISLLAKWMPSINTSSAHTRKQAKYLMRVLGMKEGEYRKLLSRLRAHIGLAERCLTEGKMDKIHYEAVPAGAMLKYHQAFFSKDQEAFSAYLADVMEGKKKIHCDTLYPYEIVRPILTDYYEVESLGDDLTLEALWRNQKTNVASENAIAVVDTSSSMYMKWGSVTPALIAFSLGLSFAEHCTGAFHNYFITFEAMPKLMKVKGDTLEEKLRYIQQAPWGNNTNLEAVFDLILATAVKHHTPQEELPSTLVIISDMEFDRAISQPDQSIYDNAKQKFEACGYQMPAVVFHNVMSWKMQTPVTAHTKGTALISGAGTNSFGEKFDGNITPMQHMLRVLTSERYAAVHA